MKRIIFIFFAAMMSTAVCSAAMSNLGGEITLYVNYERVKCGSNAYE